MSAGQSSVLADIETFFTPPEVFDTKEGRHSVLWLLRREIQECLVDAPPRAEAALLGELADPSHRPVARRLFTSAMLTLGGIDLLGKFLAGRDTHGPGEVRDRFQQFVRDYLGRAGPEAPKALWAARNALMHSFGLYAAPAPSTPRRIQLTARGGTPAVSLPAGAWQVDVLALYGDFVEAVGAYRDALRADTGGVPMGPSHSLRDRFAAMYWRYGTLVVG
jgi:hypothetical protein